MNDRATRRGAMPERCSTDRYSFGDQHWRTKLCPFLFGTKMDCERRATCCYAHCPTDLRNRPDLTKTKLCDLYMKGHCSNLRCRWAHGRHELRFTDDFYRTSLCKYWIESVCYAGRGCRHAHGIHELRPRKVDPVGALVMDSPRVSEDGERARRSLLQTRVDSTESQQGYWNSVDVVTAHEDTIGFLEPGPPITTERCCLRHCHQYRHLPCRFPPATERRPIRLGGRSNTLLSARCASSTFQLQGQHMSKCWHDGDRISTTPRTRSEHSTEEPEHFDVSAPFMSRLESRILSRRSRQEPDICPRSEGKSHHPFSFSPIGPEFDRSYKPPSVRVNPPLTIVGDQQSPASPTFPVVSSPTGVFRSDEFPHRDVLATSSSSLAHKDYNLCPSVCHLAALGSSQQPLPKSEFAPDLVKPYPFPDRRRQPNSNHRDHIRRSLPPPSPPTPFQFPPIAMLPPLELEAGDVSQVHSMILSPPKTRQGSTSRSLTRSDLVVASTKPVLEDRPYDSVEVERVCSPHSQICVPVDERPNEEERTLDNLHTTPSIASFLIPLNQPIKSHHNEQKAGLMTNLIPPLSLQMIPPPNLEQGQCPDWGEPPDYWRNSKGQYHPRSRLNSTDRQRSRLNSIDSPKSRLDSIDCPRSRLDSIDPNWSRLDSIGSWNPQLLEQHEQTARVCAPYHATGEGADLSLEGSNHPHSRKPVSSHSRLEVPVQHSTSNYPMPDMSTGSPQIRFSSPAKDYPSYRLQSSLFSTSPREDVHRSSMTRSAASKLFDSRWSSLSTAASLFLRDDMASFAPVNRECSGLGFDRLASSLLSSMVVPIQKHVWEHPQDEELSESPDGVLAGVREQRKQTDPDHAFFGP